MASTTIAKSRRKSAAGNRFARLPKPFDDIGIDVYCCGNFIVSYSGLADRLLAAGAIEPAVLKGARVICRTHDSHGFEMVRKGALDERIMVTRWIKDSAVAESLPGCAGLVPGYFRWLREHPTELHYETVQQTAREITERVTGSKEAMIARGICETEEELEGNCSRFRSDGRTWAIRMLDGLYQVEILTLTEVGEQLHYIHAARTVLHGLQLWGEKLPVIFTPDVQSSLSVVMERLEREERILAAPEKRRGLRLVVDNTAQAVRP